MENMYYELSHAQKRIWYTENIHPKTAINIIGGCLHIYGNIDRNNMNKTLNLLLKEHDGLRIKLYESDGRVYQYIDKYVSHSFDYVDFSNCIDPKGAFNKWFELKFKTINKDDKNEMHYFAIYKVNNSESGVLIKLHHIISDGWSTALISKEICRLYDACYDINYDIDVKPSYIEYLEREKEYFNSPRFYKDKLYWNNLLEDLDEDNYYKSYASIECSRNVYKIDHDMTYSIREICKNYRISLNSFMISILLIYLYHIESRSSYIIGTPIHNRVDYKEKNTIGMFTSTIPLVINVDKEDTIKELFYKVKRAMGNCVRHQRYPYDEVIKEKRKEINGNDSLFRYNINYYNAQYGEKCAGFQTEILEGFSGCQSNSLQVVIKEWIEDEIILNIDYKIDEYNKKQIDKLIQIFKIIINQVILYEYLKVNDFVLVSNSEQNSKMTLFNSYKAKYPAYTVVRLFEKIAGTKGKNIALEYNNERMTYDTLNKQANRLADYLNQRNIHQGKCVGLMLRHSFDLFVCILGILKCGATYVPIDPNYPVKRTEYILDDAKCQLLIWDEEYFSEFNTTVEVLNIIKMDLTNYSKENMNVDICCNDLAYIIYTSGSTGKPKGVMIEHKSLTNYVIWANKQYVDNGDVMACYSSISFDLTVTSLFAPLISGNKIVIYEEKDDGEFVLFRILNDKECTLVKLTPAHLNLIKDKDNSKSTIRKMIVGGENLKSGLCKTITDSFGDVTIFNEYGPTEATVGCMIYQHKGDEPYTSVPIGKPIDNTQIYILDKSLKVVPNGVSGDLYISGDCISRGYMNQKELTEQKFIDNPYIPGKKMYFSGDIAKYLDEGIIEYLGREDKQIKINGHRIEIDEIVKCLLEYEGIIDAVADVTKYANSNQIIAFVVANKKIDEYSIKQWIGQYLNHYMIPGRIFVVDSISLTINGKIDFEDLVKNISIEESQKYNVSNPIVFDIFKKFLNVNDIYYEDNYYSLGGDSIKAIQIVAMLKEHNINVKVKDILKCENMGELLRKIEVSQIVAKDKPYECMEFYNTPIIRWFVDQKLKNKNNYSQYVFYWLSKSIDIVTLENVLEKIINKYDAFNINFDIKTEQLIYRNRKKRIQIECLNVNKDFSQDVEKTYNELISLVNLDFNLSEDMLFRAIVFIDNENRQLLLMVAHHIIIDGFSWRIISYDFCKLMQYAEIDEQYVWSEQTDSYKTWANYLYNIENKISDEEIQYWNNLYNSKPTDISAKMINKDIFGSSIKVDVLLAKDIVAGIISNGLGKYNLTFEGFLMIAFCITLNELTRDEDIVFESEYHGRQLDSTQVDISKTVGWFTCILPRCIRVMSEDLGMQIKSIKEQLHNAMFDVQNFHEYFKRNSNATHKKYIRFNYLGDFDALLENSELFSDVKFGLITDDNNEMSALIEITVYILGGELHVESLFSSNRYDIEKIVSLQNNFKNNINRIYEYVIKQEEIEFTPSDFDVVRISQEDIDILFS